MTAISRRALFKGMGGAAGIASLSLVPGAARVIRAQESGGGGYDIVDFGPVTEGVLRPGNFRRLRGGITGIHGNGLAFGNVAVSDEKYSPALFMVDGTLTRLQSGAFGGDIQAINAAGNAAGRVFEQDDNGEFVTHPAAWIEGKQARLPFPPEARSSLSERTGFASAISDDGAILGEAWGHSVLWVNGEIQLLPRSEDRDPNNFSSQDYELNYRGMTANGEILRVGRFYSGEGNVEVALVKGDAVTVLDVPAEFPLSAFDGFVTASNGDILIRTFAGADLPVTIILAQDQDPLVIDTRDDDVYFYPVAFNANHDVLGSWSPRFGHPTEQTIWRNGEFITLASLLPADHGFATLAAGDISDDGILSAGGRDADGFFHPLLLVPSDSLG